MFPRQRLDAEQIRDSLLQAAGLLDETIGGPPVYPPQPAMANQAGFNENTWKTSENPRDQNRRSVYIYVKRNNPYPLLDTFDWANPQSVHGKREVTTTAPQALALINSDLVYGWSQVLAGRAIREAGDKDNKRVARLFEILYAREPTQGRNEDTARVPRQPGEAARGAARRGQEDRGAGRLWRKPAGGRRASTSSTRRSTAASADRYEKAALVSFVEKQQKPRDAEAAAAQAPTAAVDPHAARAAAFVDLAHALANSNEFSYRF